MTYRNALLASIAILALCGCDDGGSPDAGGHDSGGARDGGTADGGPSDAGDTDAGTTDAGGEDAGSTDAGSTDAGSTDAGSTEDGGGGVCSAALSITADSSGVPELVISEIDPGSFIELYNTTGADIALAGTTYQLCSPFTYSALTTLAPTLVVPAGGYAELPWPSTSSDTDAGGEIILYASPSFSTPSEVMDFVCWGTNPHSSRLSTAMTAGKWSGACAGAITGGGSLARVSGTDGTTAASYSVATPSPETCTP